MPSPPCNGSRLSLALAAMILLAPASRAQDTRAVAEPVAPPACVELEARLAAVAQKTLAPSDESRPDTGRIQQALDRCPAGRAVALVSDAWKDAFLTGPLHIPAGRALEIAKGVILFGSRNPRDYDLAPGSCGVVARAGGGCKPLIAVTDAPGAAIIGPGTIDGRGWAAILGQKVSWWDLAQQAKAEKKNQHCPHLIVATRSGDFTLYHLTLRNPAMYHVLYRLGSGFTAWGVTIDTPRTARNTDGIDPSSARNVTIAHCTIHSGDDDVSIKAGPSGPSRHITVADDLFTAGHGMSIGSDTSGGVSGVLVERLTIRDADNGLRIKSNVSRGGLVQDVIYRHVCILNTKNPILMDTHYSFYGTRRDLPPEFRAIALQDVCIRGGGRVTLDGLDAAHRLAIRFDDVRVAPGQPVTIFARHARILRGPGPDDLRVSGQDVHSRGHASGSAPCACAS